MNTTAILSNPVVASMSPEEVFRFLKRAEAMMKVKERLTSRNGHPMLGCFADLLDVDQAISCDTGS